MKQKKTIEAASLAAVMAERNLSFEELARDSGLSRTYLQNNFQGGIQSESARRKIEAALGYSAPIWSDIQTLDLRRQCLDTMGFDPCLAPWVQLRKIARDMGLPREATRSRVVSDILARAAVTKKPAAT